MTILGDKTPDQKTETKTTEVVDTKVEKSWRDSLPDDLKEDPSLKKYSDIPNLAKAYVNLNKMLGAEKIPVPGKNATDDD